MSEKQTVNVRITQSVAILIDGNNIERSLHTVTGSNSVMLNFDVIIPKLLNGRGLNRLIYFREGKAISTKLANRLLSHYHGSVVPCHKSADIPLTINATQIARKVDTIIIMSGDSDYVELVRHLKGEGVRVEIAAIEETTASILLDEADHFIPITKDDSFGLQSGHTPTRRSNYSKTNRTERKPAERQERTESKSERRPIDRQDRGGKKEEKRTEAKQPARRNVRTNQPARSTAKSTQKEVRNSEKTTPKKTVRTLNGPSKAATDAYFLKQEQEAAKAQKSTKTAKKTKEIADKTKKNTRKTTKTTKSNTKKTTKDVDNTAGKKTTTRTSRSTSKSTAKRTTTPKKKPSASATRKTTKAADTKAKAKSKSSPKKPTSKRGRPPRKKE